MKKIIFLFLLIIFYACGSKEENPYALFDEKTRNLFYQYRVVVDFKNKRYSEKKFQPDFLEIVLFYYKENPYLPEDQKQIELKKIKLLEEELLKQETTIKNILIDILLKEGIKEIYNETKTVELRLSMKKAINQILKNGKIEAVKITGKSLAYEGFELEPLYFHLKPSEDQRKGRVKLKLVLGYNKKNEQLANELTERMLQIQQALYYIFSQKTIEDLDSQHGIDNLKITICDELNSFLMYGKIEAVYILEWKLLVTPK